MLTTCSLPTLLELREWVAAQPATWVCQPLYDACPLAQYLTATTGVAWGVEDNRAWRLGEPYHEDETKPLSPSLCALVSQIDLFDPAAYTEDDTSNDYDTVKRDDVLKIIDQLLPDQMRAAWEALRQLAAPHFNDIDAEAYVASLREEEGRAHYTCPADVADARRRQGLAELPARQHAGQVRGDRIRTAALEVLTDQPQSGRTLAALLAAQDVHVSTHALYHHLVPLAGRCRP